MLEVRNLTKVYRPKKGQPVTAIDGISLRFPATGMVFLLGKSGSGKSTLLNLLGGLDRYDDGEIRINGVSSKSFRQQHFDSYRNTYVGFIFQEYNILEEFTVGANIALAIELQGRKATDAQINAILHEVDLDGYGNRRPNELSGGQKQRVAIARALVKQPRIIMADEPTGALDSNTGRQIFDTLKKLSAERLVIVVSHDREFAENYADRIIELADGHVISDLTYTDAAEETKPGLTYAGDTVHIAGGYHLTEEDREAINRYIDARQTGTELRIGSATAKRGTPTDQEAIPAGDGSFSPIRSRLPMRSAVRIGASSLKHKRIRLVITILLSCISFGLFGLADTFGSYNHIRACTDSLLDSGIGYASVGKERSDNDESTYFYGGYHISEQDIAAIHENTGVQMQGVYAPSGWDLSLSGRLSPSEDFDTWQSAVLASGFNGLTEMDNDALQRFGYELIAGRLPDGGQPELAITAYVAESFVRKNYAGDDGKAVKIAAAADMVGKKLNLGGRDYTVTGIVDTHFDLSRYQILTEKTDNTLSTAQRLVRYALQSELDYATSSSLHCTAFVGSGHIRGIAAEATTLQRLQHRYLYFIGQNDCVLDPAYIGTLADLNKASIVWLDGNPRTALGEKELVITTDLLNDRAQTKQDADGEPVDATSSAEETTAAVRAWLQTAGSLREESPRAEDDENNPIDGYTIVGYISPQDAEAYHLQSAVITAHSLRNYLLNGDEGLYDFAVGPMPTERTAVHQLVSYCYTARDNTQFALQSAVTYELDVINTMLETLSTVFLYIGIGFAVFAAIMLANFISTSIAYKKQEIGILRAIGSRSNDVFRIFFSESFIIAAINFLLSAIGVGVVTGVINRYIRSELNVLVTVLHFGGRQILLLLAVSLAVAALASFFPVRHIAAKRPIDAIRDR